MTFTRFSRFHAVLVLAACLASLVARTTWPLVAAGCASFAALILTTRGAHTPSGAFGWGNAITSLRFVLSSCVGVVPASVPTWALGATTLVLFALDGLDGAVAKRRGEASPFGAYFDMETDAYFVLVAGLALFQRGRYGAWILVAGLLRYAYVVALALVPARRGDVPRFAFGRHAFTTLMLGLVLGMVLGEPFGTVAAALGCGLVTASFAWSFYWSYSRPT
ncbi:MAG TPA: CDP-alcohol phosphatidyltransferase family protein [Polyangiaceae bacterium]|nr:CDP-alcohol phosphatidyltransferase family protein [Polyangiaceae bacterium]